MWREIRVPILSFTKQKKRKVSTFLAPISNVKFPLRSQTINLPSSVDNANRVSWSGSHSSCKKKSWLRHFKQSGFNKFILKRNDKEHNLVWEISHEIAIKHYREQDGQNLKIKIKLNKCLPFCACQIYMKQSIRREDGEKKKETTYESESKIAQLI